ncbi:MAG: hypothetical protein GY941_20985 [Planctomycetes bacterium]|nr:hypothetical protein [Planctomycetota bacterium]
MTNNTNTVQTQTQSGIGILGLLGVLFVSLKLGGIISWSWWWVTLPFWGGLALLAVVVAVVFIGFLIIKIFGR